MEISYPKNSWIGGRKANLGLENLHVEVILIVDILINAF